MLVRGRRTIEFACNSKACAPPPVGTGGSGGGGMSVSKMAGLQYGQNRLKRSRSSGPMPDVDWQTGAHRTGDEPMKGVVTTPGGRKYPVAWDEFDVGPKAARDVINQYSKMLDLYPEMDAVPLALGRSANIATFKATYSDDPYHVGQFESIIDDGRGAVGFVVNRTATAQAVMMGYTNRIGSDNLLERPEMWGAATRGLTNEQRLQYVVTHEVGHMVYQHWAMRATAGQKAVEDIRLDGVRKRLSGSTDVGDYGRTNNDEMIAESFAMQSHGLTNTSILRDVTDFLLAGAPPRRVEWT